MLQNWCCDPDIKRSAIADCREEPSPTSPIKKNFGEQISSEIRTWTIIVIHTRSSEELRDANVDNVNVTPPNVVPRLPRVSTGLGRGALLSSMLEHDMIATPVDSPSIKNTSLSGIRCDTPAFRGENHGFVQSDQPNQWQTMADLMKPLDSEIGNQIAASLSSAGQNVQRDHLSAQHPSTQPPDWSNLNLVIRH